MVLSAPVQNQSGTGSSDAPPAVLTKPGEYDSVPVGAPAQGPDASDREYMLPES
jgi:5'-nucleotidase